MEYYDTVKILQSVLMTVGTVAALYAYQSAQVKGSRNIQAAPEFETGEVYQLVRAYRRKKKA